MNKTPINDYTQQIALLVKAEEGFNPQTDLDLGSLRLGAHNKVNYGYGSRVISVHPNKKDLIIMFDAHGSGITEKEFAPKLIGKTKSGEMIYGYAKLSYVDYEPAILSALRPKQDGGSISLTVQNFGLSASKGCKAQIIVDGKLVGEVGVPSLKPYQEKTLICKKPLLDTKLEGKIEIIFTANKNIIARNRF